LPTATQLSLQNSNAPTENYRVTLINHRGLEAAEGEWNAVTEQVQRSTGILAFCGIGLIVALCVPVAMVADALVSGTAHYPALAGLMALVFAPVTWFLYTGATREQQRSQVIAASLQRELIEAVESAEHQAQRREVQVRQQEFETRLANALEMADGEPEVIDAVERALASTLPDSPVELLLADNSHAHLARVAVSSPTGEPPQCVVDSPDHCPAARRAQVQRFNDSDELDACPKLRNRAQGRCSAVCVPVSIMGRTVGVLHATGAPGVSLDEEQIQGLGTLANLAGARIGLLRMMVETQLQAGTDSLTGLLNRRSLEKEVRELHGRMTPFTLVMADLDQFKDLNDTYGHETGDRALRLFAQTLSASLRKEDVVCRHGGEEFTILLPGCSTQAARATLEHVRTRLAEAILSSGAPRFTASFGAVESGSNEDLVELTARADAALFESKREGRDRVTVHDSTGQTILDPAPRASARSRTSTSKSNGKTNGNVQPGNRMVLAHATPEPMVGSNGSEPLAGEPPVEEHAPSAPDAARQR
jgi:diguanylate cyclase (GGDEF)-like protein